jgi:hypothetical protein
MSRNLSAARRREIKARKFSAYSAALETQNWNELERERELQAIEQRAAAALGLALLLARSLRATWPIAGVLDWWLISGHPVELSRHTCRGRGRTMTAVVCEHIEVAAGVVY